MLNIWTCWVQKYTLTFQSENCWLLMLYNTIIMHKLSTESADLYLREHSSRNAGHSVQFLCPACFFLIWLLKIPKFHRNSYKNYGRVIVKYEVVDPSISKYKVLDLVSWSRSWVHVVWPWRHFIAMCTHYQGQGQKVIIWLGLILNTLPFPSGYRVR